MKAAVAGLILCVALWAQAPASQQQNADHKHDANHKHDATHKHDDPNHVCDHHKPDAKKLGFDLDKSKYHIRLTNEGGVFQIGAKDAADKENIKAIRAHLQHVSYRFSMGDFSAHAYIHGEQAPNEDVMKKTNNRVKYSYRNTDNGGEIVVKTRDAEALKAVHDFLKVEIALHETGDPTTVAAK